MPLRRILATALLSALTFSAPVAACSDPAVHAAVPGVPQLKASATNPLLALRPRVWAPASHRVAVQRAAAGLRVAVDPVDGTLGMPAIEPAAEFVRMEDGEPIVVRTRRDGSRWAVLDERFAEFSVATIGPDGKLSWTCVSGPRNAARFLANPVVTPDRSPGPGTVWEDR